MEMIMKKHRIGSPLPPWDGTYQEYNALLLKLRAIAVEIGNRFPGQHPFADGVAAWQKQMDAAERWMNSHSEQASV
jgi:hypothetical protein